MPVRVILMVLENRLYYDKMPILEYKIQYPQFFSHNYQRNLTRINNYYSSKALKLQKECTCNYFKSGIENYSYSQKRKTSFRVFKVFYIPTITYNKNCAVSLYFDSFMSFGGAHGITTRTSDTWDVQTGALMQLCELFEYNVDEVSLIREALKNEIMEDLNTKGPVYYENYMANITDNFKANNFFLLPEGIVIYFQEYTIAPYPAGIPEFLIPYNEGITSEPECL